MSEIIENKPQSKLTRILASSGVAAGLAIGLSVFLAESSPAQASTKSVKLTPNMSSIRNPHNKNLCLNGGERPCYLLLRASPELSSDYITADPNNPPARDKQWPKESWDGKTGNALTIKCYDTDGDLISPSVGHNRPSSDWYEVEVPENRILNPEVSQYEHSSMLGWASIEWFNQGKPSPNVPVC